MSSAQWYDTNGHEVLNGTLVGGGSQPSYFVRGPFAFSFNTASLAAGISFYTPAVGELLIDAWLEVTTAFDGTTPQFDLGRGDGDGLWADTTAPVDISATSGINNVLSGMVDLKVLQSALSAKLATGPGSGNHLSIGVFTTADPLLLWASQDGLRAGAAVGGTTGAAKLYLVTATPTPFV